MTCFSTARSETTSSSAIAALARGQLQRVLAPAFATLSILDMKEMGVGLAVAVLLDGTLVRAILLPAAMKLLGERNWYLPRALGWLPELREPASAPTPEAA